MSMTRAPRGLATLALLKTRFDQGHDHLGLLEPFVADALVHYRGETLLPRDIKPILESRTGLNVPVDTLRTVLSRFVPRGLLRREGGRFLVLGGNFPDPGLDSTRAQIESQQLSLGQAFRRFGMEHGTSISSDADALAMLARFIGDNKVPLLLQEPLPDSPLERSALNRKLTRLVARFITDPRSNSKELRSSLEGLVEGMVLQDTLLLSDLATVGERFRDVLVVMDSGILFTALGLTGVASGMAAKEGLTLLREAGARTVAFDCTVAEMQRILALYEERIATAEGRLSLRPTELTRHMLTSRLSPSDVRTISATLEKRLAAEGVTIVEVPKHEIRQTRDEEALAVALRSAREPISDSRPRILHDIDCVAGVLTLRAGRTSTTIERSGAIFCSMS